MPRAAVWKISLEVLESMLRMWLEKTRCQDDQTDLKVLNAGTDGRHIVVMVELVDGPKIDPDVKNFIDDMVRGD